MQVQPYLSFEGRCEEAIEFYRKAVGAQVERIMRFKDSPGQPPGMPPGVENKIMHASFKIGETTLGASDGRCSGKGSFQGISLSLMAEDDAEAERLFAGLAEGGKIDMPMAKTFFSSRFGMTTDRFGISWMVLVAH